MKKFTNLPERPRRTRACWGSRRRMPSWCACTWTRCSSRAASPKRGQGRAGLRRRIGPRAAAHRLRGGGHARRGLPGPGVHLAHAQPDAGRGQGRRQRGRRALHRQELRRRRDELPDGHGHDGRRVRHRCWSTTTWPSSSRARAAAAAWPARWWSRRWSAPPPSAARTWPPASAWATGSTPAPPRWAWRSPVAPCRKRACATFEIGPTKWRSGVGIHGEPGRRRTPFQPAGAIVEELIGADPEGPAARARAQEVLLLVNGLGGTPLMELYLLYQLAASDCAAPAWCRCARWSATTRPRWKWRGFAHGDGAGRRAEIAVGCAGDDRRLCAGSSVQLAERSVLKAINPTKLVFYTIHGPVGHKFLRFHPFSPRARHSWYGTQARRCQAQRCSLSSWTP